MISMKQAIEYARESFSDIFSETKYSDLRLEEIRFDDQSKCWQVTLGFDVVKPRKSTSLAATLNGPREWRVYKVFDIDAETGDMRAMRIREMAEAI